MCVEEHRELVRHVVGVCARRARLRRKEDAHWLVVAQPRSQTAQRLSNDTPRTISKRGDPDTPVRDHSKLICVGWLNVESDERSSTSLAAAAKCADIVCPIEALSPQNATAFSDGHKQPPP